MAFNLTKNLAVAILALLLSLLSLSLAIFYLNSGPAYIVVNRQQLFDKFSMSIEAKRSGEQTFNRFKRDIDSLNLQFGMATDKYAKENLQEQVFRQQQAMSDFQNKFTTEETKKIWDRIDAYVKDYAKAHDAKMILGAGIVGGEVLYYDPKFDATNEVLLYINSRYEGNK